MCAYVGASARVHVSVCASARVHVSVCASARVHVSVCASARVHVSVCASRRAGDGARWADGARHVARAAAVQAGEPPLPARQAAGAAEATAAAQDMRRGPAPDGGGMSAHSISLAAVWLCARLDRGEGTRAQAAHKHAHVHACPQAHMRVLVLCALCVSLLGRTHACLLVHLQTCEHALFTMTMVFAWSLPWSFRGARAPGPLHSTTPYNHQHRAPWRTLP
eukprot:363786-Chlamydomonas_euryale.AAC.8